MRRHLGDLVVKAINRKQTVHQLEIHVIVVAIATIESSCK